ncbi:hypothetical protein Q7P37_003640 [Cladosporium fusiforme]
MNTTTAADLFTSRTSSSCEDAVTPHIRSLIADHGLGAILITEKNVVDAAQLTQLIKGLQLIALEAGHRNPLLIAIDQENGPVNSIRDSQNIRQFPSAMGMAACKSPALSQAVAKAAAEELACLGVNFILGPALDVLSDVRVQPLGVRSAGHDPLEVSKLGQSYVRGFLDGGLATCGKHFPTFGSLGFHGSTLEMPIVAESLNELRRGAFVPFKAAIENGLDAVLVTASRMLDVDGVEVQHACLSEQIVTNILHHELGFDGVIISECLEVESLFQTLGVDQAVVMALQAGCNMLMVCNSVNAQLEALSGFKLGVDYGIVMEDSVRQAVTKIERLKSRVTSWERALNPRGIPGLDELACEHRTLSRRSYEASVSLVRDRASKIPFSTEPHSLGTLLLLTPLVESLDESHAGFGICSDDESTFGKSTTGSPSTPPGHQYLPGEHTFRSLGLKLSQQWVGKVSHCTYTATGLRPIHERLIASASCIVIVTADSVRNTSQYGFTKCVTALCSAGGAKKPCITVAMGSPYDFLHDEAISPYICTYDFTEPAIDALIKLLFGDNSDTSRSNLIHGKLKAATNTVSVQNVLWLAQQFEEKRDDSALAALLTRVSEATKLPQNRQSIEPEALQNTLKHFSSGADNWNRSASFVVRNSSTGVMYGFCNTSYIPSIKRGCVNMIVVDTNEQGRGIGRSLFGRAVQHLVKETGPIRELQLGGGIPLCSSSLGNDQTSDSLPRLAGEYLEKSNKSSASNGSVKRMHIPSLSGWNASPATATAIQAQGLTITRAQNARRAEVDEHIRRSAPANGSSKSLSLLAHTDFMLHLYDMAAKDEGACNILLAQAPDRSIVGSCIIYSNASAIAVYAPLSSQSSSGIVGLVMNKARQQTLAIDGLILVAVSHLKGKALQSVDLIMDDLLDTSEVLARLGFEQVYAQPVIVHDVH